MKPLVSCIMPTRNRRQYIPQAVACFQSQTWPNKELVVVDNGDDPINDLLPPGTVYTHIPGERLSTGAMRNKACSMTHGDFIAHFDDDDFSHPNRLAEQHKLMQQFQVGIVGYRSMYFINQEKQEAWLYINQDQYALGTSFLYRRVYWRANKFQNISVGEDNEFFEQLSRGQMISVDAGDRMVARIHASNTSSKTLIFEDETWKRADYDTVARIMGIGTAAAA